jgi:CDP-diacylglycerol--serine O-phosphatidyltransferase
MSAQGPHRRFQSVSIFWLLPNVLTVAGLVSGLTALRFALDGRWSGVIGLIVLAAVFDALDGRTARRFKTASAFGAALDSLSDLVVFGVVPALCLYLWALQDSGRIAWWATMFYAVAIALRLARFDSELRDPPGHSKDYFTGVPAPASGVSAACTDLCRSGIRDRLGARTAICLHLACNHWRAGGVGAANICRQADQASGRIGAAGVGDRVTIDRRCLCAALADLCCIGRGIWCQPAIVGIALSPHPPVIAG